MLENIQKERDFLLVAFSDDMLVEEDIQLSFYRIIKYFTDIESQVPKVVVPKEVYPRMYGYTFAPCSCGNKVSTTYAFCPECGSKLDFSKVVK
jgi:hypothetical protein